MDSYPYSAEWKSGVDKSGEEWRAYCESTSLVKRFLKIEIVEGRHYALQDYRQTLKQIETQRRRSAEQIERLDRDFRQIGAHEADVIRTQI